MFTLSLTCLLFVLSAVQHSHQLETVIGTEWIQANQTDSNLPKAEHTFECPSKIGYYAASESNPHKFWLCVNHVPYQFSCPKGTHFNVHENQCTNWIEESSDENSLILQHHHEKTTEQGEQQDKHHAKKQHRVRHVHKTKHHHKLNHMLERLHRRIDQLDTRLDKLTEYVDIRFEQSAKTDLPHAKAN